jgi:hypothetical protein
LHIRLLFLFCCQYFIFICFFYFISFILICSFISSLYMYSVYRHASHSPSSLEPGSGLPFSH